MISEGNTLKATIQTFRTAKGGCADVSSNTSSQTQKVRDWNG